MGEWLVADVSLLNVHVQFWMLVTGAMPFRSRAPRSSSSNRLPSSLRVLSAMTTLFGSASPCSLAAKFGVSPTMPRS